MPEDTGDALTVEVTLRRDDLDRERLETGHVATGIITEQDRDKLLESLPSWIMTLEKVDFTFSNPTYILDQQIRIPVTVHESQWSAGEN